MGAYAWAELISKLWSTQSTDHNALHVKFHDTPFPYSANLKRRRVLPGFGALLVPLDRAVPALQEQDMVSIVCAQLIYLLLFQSNAARRFVDRTVG